MHFTLEFTQLKQQIIEKQDIVIELDDQSHLYFSVFIGKYNPERIKLLAAFEKLKIEYDKAQSADGGE